MPSRRRDPEAPIETVPVVGHSKPATNYGTGRRCTTCNGLISQYTPPQPITGLDLCNLHHELPEGYTISATGRVVKEATR